MKPIRIAVVGDFNPDFPWHLATNACFGHSQPAVGRSIESRWVPTPDLERNGAERELDGFDAVWIASGSPYRSMAGALDAIRYARTRGRPLYGT